MTPPAGHSTGQSTGQSAGQSPDAPGPRAAAPLLSARGVLIAILAAICLCWPMLLVTAPLGYFDTQAYLSTGQRTVALAIDFLVPQTGGAGTAAAGSAADEAASARQLRSFVYSAYLYLAALLPGGLVLALIGQTAATLMMLFAVFRAWPPVPQALAGGLAIATLTTLPWFASYAMPDILAAATILFYVLLAGGIAHIGAGWRVGLCAIATFATISHYGHIPLAFAMMLAALAVCALRRSLTPAVLALAVLPVAAAVLLNMAASAVALDAPSAAPKRLPILLARSIDDGPAAWHLREACPTQGTGQGTGQDPAQGPKQTYAICALFPDGVPDNLAAFLWSDSGIARLSAEDMDAIRAEEGRILWNAFLDYPGQQLSSLLGNVGIQLVSIGTDHVNPLIANPETGAMDAPRKMRPAFPALDLFDHIAFWGTLAATVLAALAWRAGALPPGAGWALALCLAGLLINAAIFGGLSAPVDRYQSRVAWALPALALTLWLSKIHHTKIP